MGGINRKRTFKTRSVERHYENSADSYDVKSARNKIEDFIPRSRKKTSLAQTSAKPFEDRKGGGGISKNNIEDRTSYTSANDFQIDNLSLLDNRLTNYETHNNQAHDSLRKELEEKINKAKEANAKEIDKVEKRCHDYVDGKTNESKYFAYVKWIFPIAVTAGIAWFANSYNKSVDKIDDHEKRIIKIESYYESLGVELKVDTLTRNKNFSKQ